MNKIIQALMMTTALSACSGGGGSSQGRETEIAGESYTSFMKASLASTVGEGLDLSTPNASTLEFAASQASSDISLTSNFSTTNVQTQGVDEADILKFDGDQLLYLNRSNNWGYLPPSSKSSTQVSLYKESVLEGLEFEDPQYHYEPGDNNYYYDGLLTHQDHAALIGHASYFYELGVASGFTADFTCLSCLQTNAEMSIKFWQYQQAGEPIPADAIDVVIEGNYIDSRAIGNKLYVVSQFQPYLGNINYYPNSEAEKDGNQQIIDELTFEDLRPSVTVDGQTSALIKDTDCTLPSDSPTSLYRASLVVITEFDFDNPQAWRSTCSVGNAGGIFVSQENLYLTSHTIDGMEISKYALGVNGPEFRARGSIAGSFSTDSYRYGEVQGKLVFVNTVYDNDIRFTSGQFYHQLTVFDENNGNLNVVGQIPNEQRPEPIGKPGEQIYAVRIFDERAYVVTFEKVDPLYAIDLSDPLDPQVLGELEIPGFSSYLHPVSDNFILGVGKNAVPDSDPSSTFSWYAGLNLRLFDVTDPANPSLVQSLDYGLRGSNSELLYNPHAFTYLYNEDTGLARFTVPMSLHGDAANPDPSKEDSDFYDFTERGLYQFELDTVVGTLAESNRYLLDDEDSSYYYSYGERAVINGDSIYYAHGDTVEVIPWGGDDALRTFSVGK